MSDERQEQQDWENEGGSIEPELKQKTPKGDEIPAPKRSGLMDVFRKIIQPVKTLKKP
ncbi:MAG: hypothetical protein ACRDNP_01560 [Gaiellaceae bacterium]